MVDKNCPNYVPNYCSILTFGDGENEAPKSYSLIPCSQEDHNKCPHNLKQKGIEDRISHLHIG